MYVLISKTAEIHGWGTAKFKWVSKLSAKERKHVQNGGTVLIRYNPKHPSQCGYKRVVYRGGGRYDHREATIEQISIARIMSHTNASVCEAIEA